MKFFKKDVEINIVKRLILILLFILLFANISNAIDLRAVKLRKFLERYPGTPLINHIHEILYCADKFGLDYRLYVAISGAESGYGRKVSLKRKNFTGYLNGDVPFPSIYQNIYKTHELIGTKKWYRKYRKTKNIKDLVYTYKGVPPYDHYIRNMRYALDAINAVSVEEERKALNHRKKQSSSKATMTWFATRYDRY